MTKKRLKILITTSNFDTAGSGKVIYDLVNGLDRDKFEVEIASGNAKGAFFNVIKSLNIPIHVFSTKTSYKPYLGLPFRIFKISRFYKKQQYDIIHSWQWSSDWTEAMAAKLAGVSWIYTKKAMGFSSKHWKIKSTLADFIITINNEMQNYFPHKKAQALIPLGIDTEYYNPKAVNAITNSADSKFQIISVANLVPVKGIEVLIKAVNILQDKAIQVVILGDHNHDYGDMLKALVVDLNMTDQVVFLDKTTDVRPYIKASDLYVIPTLDQGRKEGMPMALVEAMSMAVPVLGSDISGINYVLKDFKQLLFTAKDADMLASKIKQLYNTPIQERSALGRSLRAYCETNFSITQFISKHEALYTKLNSGQAHDI